MEASSVLRACADQSGFQCLAHMAVMAFWHWLLKDSCQSSCQNATVQKAGEHLLFGDKGLEDLAEHFAVLGSARARNVLSSVSWKCLFEVMFQ